MDEGKLHYKVTLDNSELQQQAEQSKRILQGIGQTATEEGGKMEGALTRVGAAMAGAFAASQLKDFAVKVATVRGEFQQLEIAFSTMLGNKQQADALMKQLIDTAATTPFGMSDIANSAKQLLAYGTEAEKVNETLIRLGDIAAGLSIPINDLAYLYGTTMVQGRLYTQDLNQFLNRGIPLIDELAKQFGVAKEEVKKLVEQGKVGFPEVEQAIIALTSEGSKFGGLMEAQSKSITGQISNLEDAVEQMINEIGKSSEGAIGGIINAASTIVEHWKQIGIVIGGAIATWGTYKAAVLSVAAAHKLVAMSKTLDTGAQLQAVLSVEQQAKISKAGLTQGTLAYAQAVKAEVQAELEKQKALVQTTQLELKSAQEGLATATAREAKAQQVLATKRQQVSTALVSGNAKKFEAATTAFSTAQERLNTAEKAKNVAIQNVSSKEAVLNTAAKRVNTLETAANTAATTASAGATNLLTAAFNGLKTAIMTNPIGLIVGVIGAAVTALTLFNSKVEETTEMSERFGKSAADAISEVEFLSTALKGLDESSSIYKKTLEELNKILEDYGLAKLQEGASIDEVNKKREQAIELIKQEGIETQRLNGIQTANEAYKEAQKSADEELSERLANAQRTAVIDGRSVSLAMSAVNRDSKALTAVISEVVKSNGELIANKTGEELTKGRQELRKLIQERLVSMGYDKEEVTSDGSWEIGGLKGRILGGDVLNDYIEKMQEAANEQQIFIDVTNKNAEAQKRAADAHMTFAEKVSAGQKRLHNANKSASDLYENIKRIYEEFRQKDLNFTINFDAEIPAWMKNMSSDELRRLGEHFASLALNLKEGQKVKLRDGRYYDREALLQHSANYTNAAAQGEAAEKKAAAEAKEKAEKDKKEAEKRRKKAAADAKAAAKRRAEEEKRERERIARETFDRNQLIKQYNERVTDEVVQMTLDNKQREIEAMNEGFAKERAQLALNMERMEQDVKKLRQGMYERLADNKVNEWLNLNPKATKEQQTNYRNSLLDENSKTKLTDKDLTPQQQAQLEERDKLLKNYEAQSQKRLLDSLRERYQDYEAQRTEIARKAAEDRKAIEENITNPEERARMLAVLGEKEKKDKQDVYNQEAEAAQKASDFLVQLFSDASDKSTVEIQKLVDKSKELIDYLQQTASKDITPKFGFTAEQLRAFKETPEKIKAITEQTQRLENIANQSNPFKALATAVKNLFKEVKQGDAVQTLEAKLKKVGAATAAVADQMSPIAGKMKEVFEAAGNEDLASVAGGVQDALQAASNIGQGFAKGGIIGGIGAAAGEVMNVIAGAFQAEARHKKALEAILKETTAQRRAYTLAMLEEEMQAKRLNTTLGTLEYGKATNAVQVMHKAYKELGKEMQHLNEIEVKTGHKKTGLFGWGKGKDIYSGVLSVYPELINKQGEFDEKVAQTILDTRELKDEHKSILQQLIKLKETAEKAREEMKQYLTSIFGNLGNELSDALVDAFRNGTNAAESFSQSVSKMLEKMVSQMLFSKLFDDDFQRTSTYLQKIREDTSTTEEQKMAKTMAEMNMFYQNVASKQQQMAQLLHQQQSQAKQYGFDIFEAEKGARQASEKGIASASQDSVNELNGRMTAVQGHTFSIAENTRILTQNSSDILRSVMGIERNTSDLPTRLAAVEQATKAMKNSLDDITLKGIKIKN